jgi:hypothetical protein
MWFASALVAAGLALGPTTAAAQITPVETGDLMYNEFIISGFIGGSHSGSIEETKVGYGGSFDYLRKGRFGFEFLAGFSPELDLERNAGSDSVQVNNYMFNLIGAAPLGDEGNWKPYVSGGIGALTFRNDVEDEEFDLEADQSELGTNVGFGLMGFADRFGFRADVRYFHAGIGDVAEDETLVVLPDQNINFWRTSAGLSIRW